MRLDKKNKRKEGVLKVVFKFLKGNVSCINRGVGNFYKKQNGSLPHPSSLYPTVSSQSYKPLWFCFSDLYGHFLLQIGWNCRHIAAALFDLKNTACINELKSCTSIQVSVSGSDGQNSTPPLVLWKSYQNQAMEKKKCIQLFQNLTQDQGLLTLTCSAKVLGQEQKRYAARNRGHQSPRLFGRPTQTALLNDAYR